MPLFRTLTVVFLTVVALSGCVTNAGKGPISVSPWVQIGLAEQFTQKAGGDMAVTPDGHDYGRSKCYGPCKVFDRTAIEGCNENSGREDCKVFAQHKTIVWDGQVTYEPVQSLKPTDWCRLAEGGTSLCSYFSKQHHETCLRSEELSANKYCDYGYPAACANKERPWSQAAAYRACRARELDKVVNGFYAMFTPLLVTCVAEDSKKTMLRDDCQEIEGEITSYILPIQYLKWKTNEPLGIGTMEVKENGDWIDFYFDGEDRKRCLYRYDTRNRKFYSDYDCSDWWVQVINKYHQGSLENFDPSTHTLELSFGSLVYRLPNNMTGLIDPATLFPN